MVNMRTADQVLKSPAQVTYPTKDYILSHSRKRKEEAAARAKAEAQARGDDGEEEDEDLEMAQTVPRSPGQVVYLSPEQFRTLTVQRAEEQTDAEEEGPRLRTPEYQALSADDSNDILASRAISNHVPSTCPSPTACFPSSSEEGKSGSTSFTEPTVIGTAESSQESLRSWHTCQ